MEPVLAMAMMIAQGMLMEKATVMGPFFVQVLVVDTALHLALLIFQVTEWVLPFLKVTLN